VWIVWLAGFLVGTGSHVIDLVLGGMDVYAGFPSLLRLFWVSLTLVDPLTVVLVGLRRRAGIVLGAVVIVTDIAVNWTVWATIGGNPLYGAVNQTIFAAFVLVTAPMLWRWFAGGDSM